MGIEGNHEDIDVRKGNYTQINQEKIDGNKGSERQDKTQNRIIESVECQDLGEAENDLLFSSPKVRMEKLVPRIDNLDSQQMANEVEISTPKTKGVRGFSKLWQTPGEYPTSPFTPVEVQIQTQIEGTSLEDSIIEDLQVFLNKDLDSTPEAGVT